jgi:hypothetical protein
LHSFFEREKIIRLVENELKGGGISLRNIGFEAVVKRM